MVSRRAVSRVGGLPTYVAHVVPGLEQMAREEIETSLQAASVTRVLQRFDERTSLLFFRFAGLPESVLGLRLAEDVFGLLVERPDISGSRAGLRAVQSAVADGRGWQSGLRTASVMRPGKGRKPTFRVVARMAGGQDFRRVDMQRAVERGVLARNPDWRLVEDRSRFEVWSHLVGTSLVVALRLSDVTMRQHGERQTERSAALKPTVAAAMVRLSRPQDDDVFLDPMCGSGTMLIERAEVGRYRLLLGGDVDRHAVQTTLENIGPRYKPIEIRQWDARRLPLEEASVTAIVCNLPFGKQMGSAADNRALYPDLVAEWNRVMAGGRMMVLLTSDRAPLRRALQQHVSLRLEREVPVVIRGMAATIHVVRKG